MWSLIRVIVSSVIDIVALPWLITKVIRTSTDRSRAETIEIIARAAATQVLSEYPTAEWALLLDMVVRQLGDRLPPDLARRAATEALIKAGASKP